MDQCKFFLQFLSSVALGLKFDSLFNLSYKVMVSQAFSNPGDPMDLFNR